MITNRGIIFYYLIIYLLYYLRVHAYSGHLTVRYVAFI